MCVGRKKGRFSFQLSSYWIWLCYEVYAMVWFIIEINRVKYSVDFNAPFYNMTDCITRKDTNKEDGIKAHNHITFLLQLLINLYSVRWRVSIFSLLIFGLDVSFFFWSNGFFGVWEEDSVAFIENEIMN